MSDKDGYEEFEFPDEKQEKKASAKEDKDDFDFEIEDDTPAADRGREPLPKNIVDELDSDELEDYTDKVKTKMLQMKKVWHDERREKERAFREQQEALAAAQRLLQENQRLLGQLAMKKRKAPPIWLQATSKIIPTIYRVDGFMLDDLLQEFGG